MKYLIIVFTLSFSLTSWGQTKTVGPAPDDNPEHNPTPKLFTQLEETLHKREIACGVKKKGQTKDSLLDTYYRLTLTKVGSQCKMSSRIYKCINHWNVKKLMEDISASPTSVSYLVTTYVIEPKSAKDIIYFFNNLDKVEPE